MNTTEQKVIDRSKWCHGPWDGEPDHWEGEHEGFPVLAVRARGGNWCGYVAVLPGHPWHGAAMDLYSEGCEPPEVHGGITYSNECQGNICHVPKPGEPDNVCWLGFDCHHSGDSAPADEAYFESRGVPRICGDKYRTLDYVQNECRRLAEQAKAAHV